MTIQKVLCRMLAAAIAATRIGLASAAEDPLANLEYRTSSVKSGTVRLVNGEYREPSAPGSASKTVTSMFGKSEVVRINGVKTAAVVLVTETGGSGRFYDLALVVERNGAWQNADTVRLGDRVKITSLKFENSLVVLDMTVFGPGDPACCPTRRVVSRYSIAKDTLEPLTETGITHEGRALTDVLWQWRRTNQTDGTAVSPDQPPNYTVRFLQEGRIDARADCNRYFGTFTVSNASLSITISGGTRAACPPGTREEEFLRQLQAAETFEFQDSGLVLTLSSPRGTMTFEQGVKMRE